MSGVPSCASTEWSRQTTIEWMMLCGWITTSIRSGARSNSQRASITSSALFIIVAESTEILRPMTQFGCAQASSGVTSRERRRVAAAERPARRGEDDVVDALGPGRAVLGQALEDRRMLAVDRQQRRAAARAPRA